MIAALADRQHGAVARRQLIALGCTAREIEWRIQAGRLHIVHRGVYAVGRRRLTVRGRWMAAVLACGPDAVLSHRDAAALHALRRSGSPSAIHVTTPGRSKDRPGIIVHNVRHLHPDDRTILDGIPVTSVHRTLLDYAETARTQELRWAFEAYDRRNLLDMRKLDAVIARNPGRHGIKQLLALTAAYRGAAETRSRNEKKLLAALRDADVPEPSVNVVVTDGIVVDLFWAQHKLVVEVDSYLYHHTPADRAEDRRKRRVLRAAGYHVEHALDTEIDETPQAVVDDVKAWLDACAARARR
jgi:very-short-patch-repair endonuclease